ncbi:alpha/beta hydrolase [Streptomyces piniterrae]|uniref:Alpha/beta hydrolase n=1 Tax=Streptomyces piniterrae TaxID=2571125 RepID=A0A4U0MNB0_9ACTN|nr:alpha/beta hydrolase [Streptomyces piniterrae]TJZ42261.1 alpha/beta hydrolase [Streptomyces piniterrae]
MSAPDEESALLGLAPVAPDRTVAYGPHPDQIVDLYGPEGTYRPGDMYGPKGAGPGQGARPLVVLLHGGFWRAAYDRRHLSPLAAALAGHGLPVALAEYRRVGAGGGAPQTFEDVAAAIGAAAHEAGASRGLVLVGHSAGGHLALLAAARPGTPVTRIIAVAPVADLARAHELDLSEGAVAELLGAGRGKSAGQGLADRIAAADPMRQPRLSHIPVTILHGADDPDVPPEISRRYAAAHPAATTLRELPGVGHYAPVTPGTPAFRTLLTTLLDPRPSAALLRST